jgi:hypothetical protein
MIRIAQHSSSGITTFGMVCRLQCRSAHEISEMIENKLLLTSRLWVPVLSLCTAGSHTPVESERHYTCVIRSATTKGIVYKFLAQTTDQHYEPTESMIVVSTSTRISLRAAPRYVPRVGGTS